MKKLLVVGGVLLVMLMLYAGWIKLRSLDVDDGGLPLAIRWEGFYHDMNLRDVGSSINRCLGENLLAETVVSRSAGWFSGWSCDKVGNPDVIYSLNYSPNREERYFCQSDSGKTIGRFFNPDIQFKDLEFIENWQDPNVRTAACRALSDMFLSILEDKKMLIHCDAGRDRTGTYSALLAAMAAEAEDRLDLQMLDAIECDYRKTKSLSKEKYGRMKQFIKSLQDEGGVASFIQQTCSIQPQVTSRVAQKLLRN
ncbi:MAG: tyrosine-protein phosphatase [Proteobacteria bacterium]|nr:tyrosine-protein phosphatase [Pseudomonadota bacterium]